MALVLVSQQKEPFSNNFPHFSIIMDTCVDYLLSIFEKGKRPLLFFIELFLLKTIAKAHRKHPPIRFQPKRKM
jgi:hypothetical protein